LINFGLKEEDLTTGTYRLQSQRVSTDEGPPVEQHSPAEETGEPAVEEELIFYQATNEIMIHTTQLDSVGEIIDVAIRSGANHINHVHFDLEDLHNLKMQALGAATEQARQKAEVLAESAGENIKGLHSIEEGITDYTPFRMREEMLDTQVEVVAEPTPIVPDEITVRASVTAKFNF
jgi:uncharacterized protein